MNKVLLRPLKESDAPRMLEWMHDESVTRYLRLNGNHKTLEDMKQFIRSAQDERENLHRAIVDEQDNYLGTVSLKDIDFGKKQAEYAITLHSSAIGKGVSTLATDAILALAFDKLGLETVYLNVRTDNLRAVKFYEKYGFHYTHDTPANINGEQTVLRWYVAKRHM